MSVAYRLITIGPSHYCEKARWALFRARVPFAEEAHLPAFHLLATRRVGGGRTVPVLVTDSGVLSDSTDILELADRNSGGAIFGAPGTQRRAARELEDLFDEKLGPHTRRIAHFHLLGERDLMMQAGAAAPLAERLAARATYSGLQAVLRRKLRLGRDAVDHSREQAQRVFRHVTELLRDGRRFLAGDRLTAADLTFAALAAPVLLPENYGFRLPAFDELPAGYRSEVRQFRDSRAGEFALSVYSEARDQPLPIAA